MLETNPWHTIRELNKYKSTLGWRVRVLSIRHSVFHHFQLIELNCSLGRLINVCRYALDKNYRNQLSPFSQFQHFPIKLKQNNKSKIKVEKTTNKININ